MTEITPATIECWRANYGLDTKSPADAMRYWSDTCAGMAPAGAVAALGLMLIERDRLLMVIQSAHDRLLRGDDDNVLLELLQEGWRHE